MPNRNATLKQTMLKLNLHGPFMRPALFGLGPEGMIHCRLIIKKSGCPVVGFLQIRLLACHSKRYSHLRCRCSFDPARKKHRATHVLRALGLRQRVPKSTSCSGVLCAHDRRHSPTSSPRMTIRLTYVRKIRTIRKRSGSGRGNESGGGDKAVIRRILDMGVA